MKLRCLFKLCSYGSWRTMEASSIESDGEWVRQRPFERRECVYCGRRQERSKGDEWQGYHISASQEQGGQTDGVQSELRQAAAKPRKD